MKFSPRLKTAAAATAFFLPLGLAATSEASALEDSDSVGIEAVVVGAMEVRAGSDIHLGQIPLGQAAFDVNPDGTGDGEYDDPAEFTIDGPSGLDWDIGVEFRNLHKDGDPNGPAILISALSSNHYCFQGGNCAAGDVDGGELTFTLDSAAHGQEETLLIGFRVDASNLTDSENHPGHYWEEDAIELTATAVLGSSDFAPSDPAPWDD